MVLLIFVIYLAPGFCVLWVIYADTPTLSLWSFIPEKEDVYNACKISYTSVPSYIKTLPFSWKKTSQNPHSTNSITQPLNLCRITSTRFPSTDGPRLPVILGQTMLEVGVTLTLRCYADCHPQCNYTWFLGDRVFWHGSHVEVQLENLTDSSIIHCQASNAVTGLSRIASSILTGTNKLLGSFRPAKVFCVTLTCGTGENRTYFWRLRDLLKKYILFVR